MLVFLKHGERDETNFRPGTSDQRVSYRGFSFKNYREIEKSPQCGCYIRKPQG